MRNFYHRHRKQISAFAVYAALTVATLLVLFPIFWMLSISFRDAKEVFQIPAHLIPSTPTLEGYQVVLSNMRNLRSMANSFIVCGAATVLCLFIGGLASYGMSRFRFHGRAALRLSILITQMLPPIFFLVSYFLMINAAGLYNTYWGLIIVYISFTLPFCTMMLHSYLDSVPRELDEAAMIDGCSRVQCLVKVIVPLSLPGLVGTGSLAFVTAWGELMFAYTLTKSHDMRPISAAIANAIGQYSIRWNEMMALSLLASLPLIIMWIYLQKYIVRGLTAGAIKM